MFMYMQDEIIYLSKLHHLNVVKLVGFCFEDDKRLLVYEHTCEGSLEKHLFESMFYLMYLFIHYSS